MRAVLAAALAGLVAPGCAPAPVADEAALARWAAAPHRSPANVARDRFRHPLETLAFFGVRAQSTVVEILPGSAGYYLEILAPHLKARGRYIAASRDESAAPQYLADHEKLVGRLKAAPSLYGDVHLTKFNADRHDVAPPGSADFVLTFRDMHNWMARGDEQGVLRAFHRALKPGGILGIVSHRGRADLPQADQTKSGYVREDVAIALVENAGFRLVAKSEVNANPRDTKDHPAGVWTLPPTYRLKDQERAKYAAIGESDRFTLKFAKR